MVSNNFVQEVIPTFDMAANEIFFDRYPDSILEHQIQVRPYNALKTRNMRSLNPEGKLWLQCSKRISMIYVNLYDVSIEVHEDCIKLYLWSIQTNVLFM